MFSEIFTTIWNPFYKLLLIVEFKLTKNALIIFFPISDGPGQQAAATAQRETRVLMQTPAVKFLTRPDLFTLMQNNGVSCIVSFKHTAATFVAIYDISVTKEDFVYC